MKNLAKEYIGKCEKLEQENRSMKFRIEELEKERTRFSRILARTNEAINDIKTKLDDGVFSSMDTFELCGSLRTSLHELELWKIRTYEGLEIPVTKDAPTEAEIPVNVQKA